jgi:hypothetical protein
MGHPYGVSLPPVRSASNGLLTEVRRLATDQ